ncbi:hypothetical protein [Streptomyces sp. NPDC004134]|uniref:hypothetical protein n=1 Tax=Streptomyces sp. NPDC004134 TaxID=3364691 RepID=UPI0036CFF94B
MTSRSRRGLAATATAVLSLALAASGCGSGGAAGGAAGGAGDGARTAPPVPAATGTGPYPTPSNPGNGASAPPDREDPGTPAGGVVRHRDVERTDADAVSRGALTVLWTYDTAVDDGPGDAGLRAADAGWLTAEYADRLRTGRPPPAPGARWREWAGHRASTSVALEPADEAAKPADTGTGAWRQWRVTATPAGRDGWRGAPVVVAAYVHLTRTAPGEAWRVAGVTVN